VDPRVGPLRAAITELLHTHQTSVAAAKYHELRQIDARQVLAAAEQLDVANQLMADGQYEVAAASYEDFLRIYPEEYQSDQVRLILGLVYARYVPQPQRAVELLRQVLPGLHDQGQRAMAEAELQRLGAGPPPDAGPSASTP
jgi:outer membrane protein assembly factor BamD (BamD/ComL family)